MNLISVYVLKRYFFQSPREGHGSIDGESAARDVNVAAFRLAAYFCGFPVGCVLLTVLICGLVDSAFEV